MRPMQRIIYVLALLQVVASVPPAHARPADPEPSLADLVAGAVIQLDRGVPHRLSPERVALGVLKWQPEVHIDSLHLYADEAAVCEADPRLGCPVSHGIGPVWLVRVTGRFRYCPRTIPLICPRFAPSAHVTIADANGQVRGFGVP